MHVLTTALSPPHRWAAQQHEPARRAVGRARVLPWTSRSSGTRVAGAKEGVSCAHHGAISPQVREWLVPLCSQIPAFAAVGGGQLNSHKSFVVTYKLGEDEHLSEHFDNAEVTLNANLARYMASPRACKCSPRRSRLPTGDPQR